MAVRACMEETLCPLAVMVAFLVKVARAALTETVVVLVVAGSQTVLARSSSCAAMAVPAASRVALGKTRIFMRFI